MKKYFIIIIFLLVIVVFKPIFAQEQDNNFYPGKFGILGYANSLLIFNSCTGSSNIYNNPMIGFILHLPLNIALKPSFYYSHSNEEEDNDYEYWYGYKEKIKCKSNSYAVDLGIFYYYNIDDNFSLYFGPSINYSRLTEKCKYTHIYFDEYYDEYESEYNINIEEKCYSYGAMFSIGAQYMFNNRFGVFADFGIGYSRSKCKVKYSYENADNNPESESKSDDIITKGANIGAVFYFN